MNNVMMKMLKRQWLRFKYELMLCVLLLLLFRVDSFIQYILFEIAGMDYKSIPANVIGIILHMTVFCIL